MPVEDESWRIGSTVPRLYTPPLAAHVDDSAEYGIRPEATWGPDCVDFLEGVLGWELLPWQRWLFHHALEKKADGTGFRFQITTVLVARQNGKLIDVDESVLTTEGWRRMGDLQDGDYVFHPDGHPTQIIRAHDVECDKASYLVTTSDGRSVVAGGEHQWAVQDRRRVTTKGGRSEKRVRSYEWEVLTTDEIMARGLQRQPGRTTKNDYAFRLPVQKRIISKPVELPIDPYLLGVWLGDGSSSRAQITSGDQDINETQNLLREAGAIILKLARLDGTVQVLNQARMGDGGLVWARPLGDAVPDARAAAWCDGQVKFDPDLWIVEIEDRQGRAFVDEPIV